MRPLALALAVLAGGCGGDRPAVADRVPAGAALEALPSAPDSGEAGGIALRVRKVGELSWVLHGRTPAVRALELTVEDGSRVLYGPAEVPVADERFRIEFSIEPTDSATVYAYLTEPSGRRQWRVPVPRRMREVAFGAGGMDVRQVTSEE